METPTVERLVVDQATRRATHLCGCSGLSGDLLDWLDTAEERRRGVLKSMNGLLGGGVTRLWPIRGEVVRR